MEQLLTILKLCLLAVLYLFFLRVLRAVWVEVNGPKQPAQAPAVPAGRVPVGPAAVAAAPPPASEAKGRRARKAKASQLTVVEPADQRGRVFHVADELTVGRAAGCRSPSTTPTRRSSTPACSAVTASSSSRTSAPPTAPSSTRSKVTGPSVMGRGDRLQVGNTVLELS